MTFLVRLKFDDASDDLVFVFDRACHRKFLNWITIIGSLHW